jgi:hypothetical protein
LSTTQLTYLVRNQIQSLCWTTPRVVIHKLDKDAVSVVESTQYDNLICDASTAEVSTVLISNVNPNFVDARSTDNSRQKVIPRQTRLAMGSTTNAFLQYNDDCHANPDQAIGQKSRCHECSGCIIS